MESSQFNSSSPQFDSIEQMESTGATCDVFRVKLYGKLHILKRLNPQFAGNILYHEALHKEFETGYRLEHPHLVRYISFNDDSILMEYVDGETLTQRLAQQPDYFRKRRHLDKFISQLLDAVGYMHSHQVLHLDLKPDNILLTRIGDDVKLIDLGCCLTDTFADTPGYTPAFAAPEQLSGDDVDVRTDIYAIGRILELLPHPYIYNNVLARCTVKDKEKRYKTVDELHVAIRRRVMAYRLGVMGAVVIPISALLLLLASPHLKSPTAGIEQKQYVDTLAQSNAVKETGLDTIALHTSTLPAVPAPIPAPVSNDGHTLDALKADIRKSVLPRFQSTMGLLSDSVKPGSMGWAQANEALLDTLKHTLQDIILRHQEIPEETVAREYHDYLQSLITLKVDRALAQ